MSLKKKIIEQTVLLGFQDVRFARAAPLDNEKEHLQTWLEKGYHGEMQYMENHFEKRTDPTFLVPRAKTVICLSTNYFNPVKNDGLKISMYALGRDYHKVIKKKLKKLFAVIKESYPELEGRYFVDSAPVMERDWARRSGLGWTGKNTLTIHPEKGSYFFLSEMIINLDIEVDDPIQDYCGTCTKCIEACPTGAISESGYVLDGSKCISYLTIEKKGDIPEEFRGSMENWIYGCDICQEVCPWNRFSKKHEEGDFNPKDELLEMTSEDWRKLTEEDFDRLFFGSPVKRTKYEGLKRNIEFLEE